MLSQKHTLGFAGLVTAIIAAGCNQHKPAVFDAAGIDAHIQHAVRACSIKADMPPSHRNQFNETWSSSFPARFEIKDITITPVAEYNAYSEGSRAYSEARYYNMRFNKSGKEYVLVVTRPDLPTGQGNQQIAETIVRASQLGGSDANNTVQMNPDGSSTSRYNVLNLNIEAKTVSVNASENLKFDLTPVGELLYGKPNTPGSYNETLHNFFTHKGPTVLLRVNSASIEQREKKNR